METDATKSNMEFTALVECLKDEISALKMKENENKKTHESEVQS